MSSNLLRLENICMDFEKNRVLNNVNMEFHPGEVVAIIGHNGAGKSTLMNIMAGALKPTEGKIYIDEKQVVIDSPKKAASVGICMVHQELCVFNQLTVWENLYIRELKNNKLGLLDHKKMLEHSKKRMAELGLDVDPDEVVGRMPVSQKQMMEICREIGSEARILILDEPTSAIGKEEVHKLYELIETLKTKKNMCIIYISHRLDEVMKVSNRIYALREGRLVKSCNTSEASVEMLAGIIMGGKKSVNTNISSESKKTGNKAVLSVKGLCSELLEDVSFELQEGEVLGLAGLMGSGRTEILESIYGCLHYDTGEIWVKGMKMPKRHNPANSIKNGICLAPEDRKEDGLFLGLSIKENISLPVLHKLRRLRSLLDKRKIVKTVQRQMEKLEVISRSMDQRVGELSGGNQQKVVLAKWLGREPQVLLMDEPTRGIDIATKEEIFRITRELANSGVSVIFVSSDFSEILRVCDRVLFVHNGRIVHEVNMTNDLTEDAMMVYVTGSVSN